MFNLILGTVVILSAPLSQAEDSFINTELQVSKTIVSPYRQDDGTKLGELKSYIFAYRPHAKKPSDIGYELTKIINQQISRKYRIPSDQYYMFGGYMLEVNFNGTIRYNDHFESMSIPMEMISIDYANISNQLSLYDFIRKQEILDETCDLDRYFYDRYYNNYSGLVFRYRRDFSFVNELHAHINACIVGYDDNSDFTYHKHRALRLLAYLKAFPAYYQDKKQIGMISINQVIAIFEKKLNEIHIDTTCTNWDKSGLCGLGNYKAY